MPPFTTPDDVTSPLAQAWREVLARLSPAGRALFARLAVEAPPALAVRFYAVLMVDARANRFLDHEQVRNRLQPSLQQWIIQLLQATAPDVEDLIRRQAVIGDVHARVGIPVDLVLRGMRALKLDMMERLHRLAPDPALAHETTAVLVASMDIAQEGMTLAYAMARDRSARVDASYRLFSLIQNITAERERQRALLLAWENELLYALASPEGLSGVAPLSTAEFGLWFTHKGIPSFGQSSETAHIQTLITEVDALLAGRHADFPADAPPLARLPAIRQRLEQIRELQSMLFERIGQLDSGSDTLTSLLNRRFLPTVLRREIELAATQGTGFAVLLIDLDHFKAINDQHGHDTGDRALQQVATLLSQYTRGSDYLFRYGGEEFVVVLVGVTTVQAQVIAENLRKRIASHPLALPDGSQLQITASIGVAPFDGHPDYEQLMSRADDAMYQAKRNGRDQVVVSGA